MNITTKFDMFADNEVYQLRPIPEIYQLSKSKIDLFFDCHWKYFFRYLTNYPVVPTVWPATLFGETIHEILEFVIEQMQQKQKESTILKAISPMFKTIFDRKMDEKQNDFKKSKNYRYDTTIRDGEKYSKILASFVINYFKDFHTIISEVAFEQQVLPNVKFTGFADLIVFDSPETYSIIDFKTTKDSYKFYVIDWNYDLQSNIYLYLSKNMFSNIYAKRFSYLVMNYETNQLFLKSNKTKENLLSDEHYIKLFEAYSNPILEFSVNFTADKFKKINATLEKCYWCAYKDKCKFNKSR